MKNYLLTSLFVFLTILVFAQAPDLPKGETFQSMQYLDVNGKRMEFFTEVGTVQLRDENDHPIALSGFTYYKKKEL